jgi:uncharacterized RDD family membrane protein YckC
MNDFNLREQRFAGIWKRAQAEFIDAVILIPYALILRYIDNYLMFSYKHKVISVLSHILIPYLPTIYTIIFLGFYSQTPGMMRCEIKTIDNKGKKISLYQNLLREVIVLPSFIVNIYFTFYIYDLIVYTNIPLANFQNASKYLNDSVAFYKYTILWVLLLVTVNALFMFRNYKKQTLQDFIAGTYVVYDKI